MPASPYSMRRAAWYAVQCHSERDWRVSRAIEAVREVSPLDGRDAAAAASLAACCVRRRATLDAVLAAYIDRERGKVEPGLWSLCQVGAAQLLFRPHIPTHAAIHATVGVASEIRQERWTGFVNGTLRKIAGDVAEVELPTEPVRTVAGEAGSPDWLTLGKDLFKPTVSEDEWLSKAFSLPRWLVRRWTSRMERRDALAVLRASNDTSGMWLRLAPRTDRDAFVASLEGAEPGALAESVWLPRAVPLADISGFSSGSCSVQDLTAMRAVDLLAPEPGESVLDLCAAPGGKTGHVAERLGGRGRVVAADVSEERLQGVAQNVDRLSLTNVEVVAVSRHGDGLPAGPYDAALVDVPCTNSGVLAKRPEARWRVKSEDVESLPSVQVGLLSRAMAVVRPGGRVVYSTCSIEPEENRAVVTASLAAGHGWSLVEDHEQRPDGRVDGGYRALLRRDAG